MTTIINMAFSCNYEQKEPSDTWTVVHGVKTRPNVSVAVWHEGVLQAVLPQKIEYVDDKTVVIKFTKPFAGTARLI